VVLYFKFLDPSSSCDEIAVKIWGAQACYFSESVINSSSGLYIKFGPGGCLVICSL